MQNDPKVQVDGYVSWVGGQDSGRTPTLLAQDQSFELWNVTVRNGFARPRPGFKQIDLSYPNSEVQSWFADKQLQGSIGYKPLERRPFSVWCVGGRFFTVSDTGEVQEITTTLSTVTLAPFLVPAVGSSIVVTVSDADKIQIDYPIYVNGIRYQVTAISGNAVTMTNEDDTPGNVIAAGSTVTFPQPNAQHTGICYMIQAEEFLIAQDGTSLPFIFDGSRAWRSNGTTEVPVGTVMAYGIGRLWVAVPGNAFVASDIVRGPSGTSAYGLRDAILKFTENTFLSGGGSFAAPGEIRAMVFMSSMNTATGQGPLMIFCENCILSVNAPADRDLWAVLRDPIQTVSLLSNGACGFYSTVPTINGDIFYRSIDGIRSFYYAVRQYGTWGSTPISSEMSTTIDQDDTSLLKYSSAIVFDNRLITTSGAQGFNFGAKWRGFAVLDFDPMTAMAKREPPVWDGTWTGVDTSWVYKLNYGRSERAFIAARGHDSASLWEITKDDKFDDGNKRIRWTIITRALVFDGGPMEMRRLQSGEAWFSNAVGTVDLTLQYRADEYPCWQSWGTEGFCVDYRQCAPITDCSAIPAFRPGYKTRINFGQPPDTDETNDGKPARLGYEHQFKLNFEGYCELKKIRFKATQVQEEANPTVS